MSDRGDKLLEGFKANKLTIEELEAIVELLTEGSPLTPIEEDALASALAKMRWHIATAHNEMSVEQRRKDAAAATAHNEGDE